jgi:glycosyltransferase involved in cell wall biosynthesis
MGNPLVSVITPTWHRHDMLLNRCIPSVTAQIYPAIEHIIVSDGPDWDLQAKIDATMMPEGGKPIRFDMLTPDRRGGRWGVAPRLRGLELAQGELVAYLDDDDAYRPDHVAMLVGALQEHPEAGFAYSKMASHGGVQEPPGGTIIGGPELGPCAVGSPMIMHRKELTGLATWGPPNDMEDWRLVDRWLERGVEPIFVPWVTVDVYPSAYRGE